MSRLSDDHPRRLHYQFAHRSLRTIVEKDPGEFARRAARGDFASALTAVWDAMNAAYPSDQRIQPTGLATRRYGDQTGRTIVIVTMPRAEHAAEAHLVAVVIFADATWRYLTLEHGWDLDDSPRTVLCEWTARGHVNLGDGPSANLEDFHDAVLLHLERGTPTE